MKVKGKKVLVVGLGKSGEAAVKYLTAQGAKVTVTDEKTKQELAEAVKNLEPLKPIWELGKFNEKTFTSADLIFLSPGVPPTLPEVAAALAAKSLHQRHRVGARTWCASPSPAAIARPQPPP